MITDTTTTITAREQVPTARVTLGELADFAKIARKAAPDRRRRTVRPGLFTAHLLITPGSVVGGTPDDVMVSTTARIMSPDAFDEAEPRAIAVPLDVIAEAAKRARKLSAIITPGSLNREDGATFTWRDPDVDAYAVALAAKRKAFGERNGGAALAARFAATEWATLVGAVAPAAGRDESRPVLTGIMLRTSSATTGESHEVVQCAATDSYRMHVGTALAYVEASTGDAVVIPAKAAALTLDVRGVDTVTVDAREHDAQRVHVTLRKDEPGTGYALRVSCVRVAGQYPNVDALRPDSKGVSAWAALDAGEAAETVKAAAGVAKRSQRRGAETVIMYLEGGARAVRVSVREADDAPGGEWQVPAIITATTEEIGVNGGFLADALRAVSMTATDAVITLHGALRPILVEQPEADASTAPVGLWCVVMPIRI